MCGQLKKKLTDGKVKINSKRRRTEENQIVKVTITTEKGTEIRWRKEKKKERRKPKTL